MPSIAASSCLPSRALIPRCGRSSLRASSSRARRTSREANQRREARSVCRSRSSRGADQRRGDHMKPTNAAKKPHIYAIVFAKVYPLYVEKAEKKGRTKKEVD